LRTYAALLFSILASSVLVIGPRAEAQDTTTPPAAPQPPHIQPTASEIQPAALAAQIEQLEANEELAVEQRTKLLAIYRQALASVEAAEKSRAAAERFAALTQGAPDKLIAARKELAELDAKPEGEAIGSDTLANLKLLVTRREAEMNKLRQSATALEAAPKFRLDRRALVPGRMSEIKDELDEVAQQLAAVSSLDSPVARANRAYQLARQLELNAEAASLESEIHCYDAEAQLLPLRGELTQKRLEREERFVKTLREEIDRLTRAELERQAEEARRDAVAAHPAVRELAEEYAHMTERQLELRDEIARVESQADRARERLEEIREVRVRAKERLERTGLNATFGAFLSKQRDLLPNRRDLQRRISSRVATIDQIELAQYEFEDRLKEYQDDVEHRDGYLAELRDSVDDDSLWSYLEWKVGKLLPDREAVCSQLLTDYNNYLAALVELDVRERDLLHERDDFADFIDQRVLWLPNMPSLGARDLSGAWHVLQWLGRPAEWLDLTRELAGDAAKHPLTTFLFLSTIVAMVVLRPRLGGYIKDTSAAAMRGSFDQFAPTLNVAGGSIILALPAVWILAYLAWRIGVMEASSRLAVPVSSGLGVVALLVLVGEMWRQFFRPDGITAAHFGWSENCVRAMRLRIAHWIAPIAVFVFLVAATSALEDDQQAASLGRLTFALGMLASTVPLYRTLDPRQWLLKDFLAWSRDGWLYRLRYVWFLGFVAAPPALALLAALGYYYTAIELTVRAFATLCFGSGLIVTREIVFRALLIAHRRLAMEQARQRRAAARAAAEAAEESAAGQSSPIPIDERQLDLSAVSGQTRRLVRAVLVMTALVATYAIWVDVLPALAVLDRIVLWATESGEAITLRSALFSSLIGMLTLVAWKNIPGLLEIAVLQKLPLEPSSRFAIATLTSYFIAVIGTVATFQQFGIGWQNVQWLIAAMTVGLGFGLQEIFANFVSGLIILFERPIRVGDVVTAGDVTGAVTKIRVRATTITNWDRKELIIPNKEFVTGRVMNWTLSDQVNRVTINVHVAYDTDAATVLEILQQIAEEHPLIMRDPAPSVSFEEFGASSLTFVLQAFLPTLDVRAKTVTELHSTIQRRFAEANIEMAFPQQDIHVRSIDASLPFLARLAEREDRAA
jgi:potassium efflux system protein